MAPATPSPASPFDLDLSLVLLSEGSKVDNKFDPGGRTNEGITQHVYDAWRDKAGLPRRDVFLITAAEVRAIYHDQYAAPLHVDGMPAAVGYAVFDAGVNSGVTQSAKWLQAALKVATDGHLGLITLAALRGVNDVDGLVDRLLDARLGMLRHLPTWAHFGAGWSKRVSFVRQHAHAMSRPVAIVTIAAAKPSAVPHSFARSTAPAQPAAATRTAAKA